MVYPIFVPEAPSEIVPPGAAEASFVLRKLEIGGSSRLTDVQFADYSKPLMGQRVSVARLFELAAQVERDYRGKGFQLSRVIVPEQEVWDGLFKLQIVEGFISAIDIRGDIGPSSKIVRRMLEPLTRQVPASIQQIERRLLLSNDLPGTAIHGRLEPDPAQPGGSLLVILPGRR